MADSFTYSLSTMWAQPLTPVTRQLIGRRAIAPLPRTGEGMGVRAEAVPIGVHLWLKSRPLVDDG